MGGYRRVRTVKLTWADDTEFAGFEVRAKRISVGKFLGLMPLLDLDMDAMSAADVESMRELFVEFGRVLVSWNLEDEDSGDPVPCTPDAFLEQDLALVMAVISAYGEHVAGVAAPLDSGSPSGEPSLEASIPMEPLSSSLAS